MVREELERATVSRICDNVIHWQIVGAWDDFSTSYSMFYSCLRAWKTAWSWNSLKWEVGGNGSSWWKSWCEAVAWQAAQQVFIQAGAPQEGIWEQAWWTNGGLIIQPPAVLLVLVAVSSSNWRILRETDPPPAIMEGDFGTSNRIVDFPLNKIKETLCNTPTVCSKTSQMLETHVSSLWDTALLYLYLFEIGFPWSSHRKRKGHDPLWARPPKARAGRNVNEEPKFVQGCVSCGTVYPKQEVRIYFVILITIILI